MLYVDIALLYQYSTYFTVLVNMVMTTHLFHLLLIHFTYLMPGGKMSSTKQKPIRKVNVKYKKISCTAD